MGLQSVGHNFHFPDNRDSGLCISISKCPLFIRTLIILGEGPILMQDPILTHYILNGPISKTGHVLRLEPRGGEDFSIGILGRQVQLITFILVGLSLVPVLQLRLSFLKLQVSCHVCQVFPFKSWDWNSSLVLTPLEEKNHLVGKPGTKGATPELVCICFVLVLFPPSLGYKGLDLLSIQIRIMES